MKRKRLRERLRGLFRAFARRFRQAPEIEAGPDGDDRGPRRELVEHAVRPDGWERISFYRRPDGLWVYSVDKFHVDDFPEDGFYREYWHPILCSGLYDSLATARREAAAEFPWVATG